MDGGGRALRVAERTGFAYVNGVEVTAMEIVFNGSMRSERKPGKPVYRYARTAEGRRIAVRVVDADSPTFAEDFEAAFNANIRRARRANQEAARKA